MCEVGNSKRYIISFITFQKSMKAKDTLGSGEQPTVFGSPKHSSVVFCIDGSKRLQEVTKIIFQHLIAHLHEMHNMFDLGKFNVILYSDKVCTYFKLLQPVKYALNMQTLTRAAIIDLDSWLNNAKLGNRSYALPGILCATGNSEFCGIYFVTDGYSDDVSAPFTQVLIIL